MKCWCLIALAFSFGLGFKNSALAQPACAISFPPPVGNVLSSYIDVYPNYPNSDATFNIIVSTTNQPLATGAYLGWCVDGATELDVTLGGTVPGTNYIGDLFPDCDTNLNNEIPQDHPASCYVSPAVWQEVNYILNHKNGDYFWAVEVAILDLVGGPAPPSSAGYPSYDPNQVAALLNDATNNAANWTPQCGDVVGAVYVITNQAGAPLLDPVQLIIVEVPVCPITFSMCPTNISLGCNPSPASIPQCQNPVNTNLVNATSCCGRPVTISCDSTQATFGCQTIIYFTYTATDGFGNSATCVQTVTYTTDVTAPTIIAPAGGNLGCNPASVPTVATITPQVSATDDCSGSPTIKITSMDTGSPCGYTRTFTITACDGCKNMTTKMVVYTWTVDITAPIVTVPGGTNLGCNPFSLPTVASITAQVSATDNCTLVSTNVSSVDKTNGCTVTRTFTVTATDECKNVSVPQYVVYTWTSDTTPPVVNCPPDYNMPLSNTVYCTYNPSDYGAPCTGTNISSILTNCFKKIYPAGYVQCGNGYYFKFTTCISAENFVDCTGTPGCLKGSYSNPTKCEAGEFAGAVLCLKWNVDLGDNCSSSGFSAGCGDLVLNDPTCSLNGCSIRQILNICHTALGGGNVSGYGCTIGSLDTLCSNLNNCFEHGTPSTWCRGHIIPPAITNVPPSISGYATTVDKCSSTPALTYSDVITTGACAGSYTIARTWLAVDGCGNTNYCVQNINVGSTTGSVCGYVFMDCNGDGLLTPGIDQGMSNIAVTLKNGSGVVIATNSTDSTGAYCFYQLVAGTYTVSITSPASYSQTAGTHTNHWADNNGNQCWFDNDGYQHCKAGGVDCWTANDGYQHSRNSNNQDCWKDSRGVSHCQALTYTPCDLPKNNSETFTLAACESKSCVNFAYQGVAPKVGCSVSGPSKGVCGQTLTYTCCVTNTGTSCFTSCSVSACGQSYTCPALSPGQSCTFPINYTCKYSDYGSFKCQANVSCGYSGSSSSCTSQSSCNTSVGFF
jgi:hypothetical protein